jgi:hypothetical protein
MERYQESPDTQSQRAQAGQDRWDQLRGPSLQQIAVRLDAIKLQRFEIETKGQHEDAAS